MSITPSDAVVAIRSFPRRWQELRETPKIDPALLGRIAGMQRRARNVLADTATALGFRADGDLDDVADALAASIDGAGPDRWRDEHLLHTLDLGVQDAAAALRDAVRLVISD